MGHLSLNRQSKKKEDGTPLAQEIGSGKDCRAVEVGHVLPRSRWAGSVCRATLLLRLEWKGLFSKA